MAQRASSDAPEASIWTPYARQSDRSIHKPQGVQKARAKHAMKRGSLGKTQDDHSIEANMFRKRYVRTVNLVEDTDNVKILRASVRDQELYISTSAGTAQQVRHVS